MIFGEEKRGGKFGGLRGGEGFRLKTVPGREGRGEGGQWHEDTLDNPGE